MNKKILEIKQKNVEDLTGEDQIVYVPCNWINSSLDVNLKFIPIDKKLVYVLNKEYEEGEELNDNVVDKKEQMNSISDNEIYTEFEKVEDVDLPEEVIKPAPQVKRGRPKKSKK